MQRFMTVILCTTAVLSASCVAAQEPAPEDSDWRTGAVCYEIFVRSFYDSDGDGVGDLEGLIEKLDYVNDGDPDTGGDLGARCIWLMPVAASPSYHGYDVTDYYRIDPRYGSNADFERLVEEAHGRGIRVLVDMVINHASSEHPFFKHALLYRDSPYREWFRWSESPGPDNEYGDNNWHLAPTRDEYYYGFFSPRMPDLNWETEAVREEMKRTATYWLEEMGADGLRLDAVRHLMEDDEGVSTNVPRTHNMLREYGAHVRAVNPESFTIGEVFDDTEAILAYYPEQLDAYFAFGVSEAILEAVRTGSSTGLLEEALQMQDAVPNNRWSPFLRNHDQTRTMTWLEGDMDRAKLAATLLLTLPGVPFVYYGEEIGMTGDKPDPRIRTPMHWTLGPAAGFTTGVPWEPLQPDSLAANVEAMDDDPGSLLNLYRELIHLRTASPALGAGELIPLHADTDDVAAYLRSDGDHVALVVANLGSEPLSGVALSSDVRALPPGRYAPDALLGGGPAAPLEIGGDGRLRAYAPVAELAPLRAYVFDVSSEG
jgi:glycosidase